MNINPDKRKNSLTLQTQHQRTFSGGIAVREIVSGLLPCGITSEEKARKTGAGEVKWKVWNTST